MQGRGDEAESYWQKGEDTLNSAPANAVAGIFFAEEVFYLRRKGLLDKAEHYRQQALRIFEQYNAQECMAMLQNSD
jgi:hypothetical protein